jgi:hypothetical protein
VGEGLTNLRPIDKLLGMFHGFNKLTNYLPIRDNQLNLFYFIFSFCRNI